MAHTKQTTLLHMHHKLRKGSSQVGMPLVCENTFMVAPHTMHKKDISTSPIKFQWCFKLLVMKEVISHLYIVYHLRLPNHLIVLHVIEASMYLYMYTPNSRSMHARGHYTKVQCDRKSIRFAILGHNRDVGSSTENRNE